MRFTIKEILQATTGELLVAPEDEERLFDGIVWDSREVTPGCVYLALPGQRVDGHDFVAAALESRAGCALVARDMPEDVVAVAEAAGAALVKVADTSQAIVDLARAWRPRLSGLVVGITGSSGKTTTKNLVRDVLASTRTVVATKANQNNELGVPRTVLNAAADTEAVVVEMGMRGLHQIDNLCTYVQPQWGLITNVGESHIELLGSRANIARAKAELFGALPDKTGVAFVNAADDYAEAVVSTAQLDARGVTVVAYDGSLDAEDHCRKLRAGARVRPAVWAQDISLDGEGRPTFTLCAAGFDAFGFAQDAPVSCTLALQGLHNVSNAVSAAAVGHAAGMSLEACAQALEEARPESGRQEILTSANGVNVINDSYNANPDSMHAALTTLSALDVAGKRVAVLGDMGELGSFAEDLHRRVGTLCASVNLDLLVCVGDLARFIAEAAVDAGFDPEAVTCTDTNQQALAYLAPRLKAGDTVLVKASHFMRFDEIVKGLIA